MPTLGGLGRPAPAGAPASSRSSTARSPAGSPSSRTRAGAAYRGVGEESVYVAERARGRGVGTGAARGADRERPRRRPLDPAGGDLPGERGEPRAAPLARLPRGRRPRADRAARRRLARRRPARATPARSSCYLASRRAPRADQLERDLLVQPEAELRHHAARLDVLLGADADEPLSAEGSEAVLDAGRPALGRQAAAGVSGIDQPAELRVAGPRAVVREPDPADELTRPEQLGGPDPEAVLVPVPPVAIERRRGLLQRHRPAAHVPHHDRIGVPARERRQIVVATSGGAAAARSRARTTPRACGTRCRRCARRSRTSSRRRR